MQQQTLFSAEPEELSCIIGNLFCELEPPCHCPKSAGLTLCGTTYNGNSGRLVIQTGRCVFYGPYEDLAAARKAHCPERSCAHGR